MNNKEMNHSKNDYQKCECGSYSLIKNEKAHKKTFKHINFLKEKGIEFNIDDTKYIEYIKKKREAQIKHYHNQEKKECVCGGYYTQYFLQHTLSNKHMNYLYKHSIIKKPTYTLT